MGATEGESSVWNSETTSSSLGLNVYILSSSPQYISPQPGEGPKSRSLERKQQDPVVLTKWRHSTYLLELNDKVGAETLPIRCGLIPVYSPAAQTGEGCGCEEGGPCSCSSCEDELTTASQSRVLNNRSSSLVTV